MMLDPYEEGITDLSRTIRIIDEAIANRCDGRWMDGSEPVCETHGFLWEDGVPFCNDENASLIWALVGPVTPIG